MMKTGKNKRLLASILAASMLLAMSPFALAEGTEGTTGQEQSTSQSAEVKTEGEGTGIAEPEKRKHRKTLQGLVRPSTHLLLMRLLLHSRATPLNC